MAFDLEDTIVALASAPGPAARAIVRISGPAAVECVRQVFVARDAADMPRARLPTAFPGDVLLGDPPRRLPCDLYLWPTLRSYTRAPTAELHLLGSPPLAEMLVSRLCACGARLARPGEFTLRAFLAGRLDLTQAEAVLGVIDAEDERQLQVALTQLAGGLARPLARLRGDLLDLLAELEAGLDFAEEDLTFVSRDEIARRVAAAHGEASQLAAQIARRAAGGEMVRIVLVGRPNAGKSSLFNALAGEQAAIVAEVAGTTRDYVARTIDLDGLSALLVDTAGLDPLESGDALHAAAQMATEGQEAAAGLLVACLDPLQPAEATDVRQSLPASTPHILVWTKADLAAPPAIAAGRGDEPVLAVSSTTGVSLRELRQHLAQFVRETGGETAVAGTALRSAESLRQAAAALARAQELAAQGGGDELLAAELRGALEQLGLVAGVVYTDDLLDRIFSRFCIGK